MAINFPQANLKQCTRATAVVFNNECQAIVEIDKGRVSLLFWSAVLLIFSFKIRRQGNISRTFSHFGKDYSMLTSHIRAKSTTQGSWNSPKCVVRT